MFVLSLLTSSIVGTGPHISRILRMHLQGKELSAERVFFIFTAVGIVRAPLGGVAMGFSAVVDGLTAFRRLNAFASSGFSD